ncbi:hypothetical protein Droror1_Dr00012219 [Drosera rotundifolia]
MLTLLSSAAISRSQRKIFYAKQICEASKRQTNLTINQAIRSQPRRINREEASIGKKPRTPSPRPWPRRHTKTTIAGAVRRHHQSVTTTPQPSRAQPPRSSNTNHQGTSKRNPY